MGGYVRDGTFGNSTMLCKRAASKSRNYTIFKTDSAAIAVIPIRQVLQKCFGMLFEAPLDKIKIYYCIEASNMLLDRNYKAVRGRHYGFLLFGQSTVSL